MTRHLFIILALICLKVITIQCDPRIVGGIPVQDRVEFAYQVSIRHGNRHFCGGVLIENRHVLTAAHCFEDALDVSRVTLVAGDLLLSRPDRFTQQRNVKKVFKHELYQARTSENDIALIRVDKIFTYNQNVQPIPLRQSPYEPGNNCVVSGWGDTENGAKKGSDRLLYTLVDTVSGRQCNIIYSNRITEGMLCAWGKNKDACQGDSGGPFVCNGQLAGLVSWGYGCAQEGFPGVYTKVQVYNQWVNETMQRSTSTKYTTASILYLLVLFKTFYSYVNNNY